MIDEKYVKMAKHFTPQVTSMDKVFNEFKRKVEYYASDGDSFTYYRILGWLESLRWSEVINELQLKILTDTLEKAHKFVHAKKALYEKLSDAIEEPKPKPKYAPSNDDSSGTLVWKPIE